MVFQEIEDKLNSQIIGQPEATNQLAKLYFKVVSGVRPDGGKPIDSIYLAGPSGVGKTESVLAFMFLFGAEKEMLIKVDGGSFQHGHEVAALVGSPPGYLGHDITKGMFHPDMMKVKTTLFSNPKNGTTKPLQFILIDEAEKANEKLHMTLLTVLDKGSLVMGDNKTSDFSNSIIFFTANLGNDELERGRKSVGFRNSEVSVESAFRNAYEKLFRPEYRGRVNKTLIYSRLNESGLMKIIDLKLQKMANQFKLVGYWFDLTMSDTNKRRLIKNVYDVSEGARSVIKALDNNVQDNLIILSQTKELKGSVSLEVSTKGEISFGLAAGK